jgi:hypothetical protein
MRLHQRAAVRGEHGERGELPVVGAPAPGFEQVQKPRRDFAERRALPHARTVQQQRGRLVDEADRVVCIHDQDALAQVLDDELVELGEVGHVDLALAHALLALAQVARQRSDAERHDEYECADDAGRHEIAAIAAGGQCRERLLHEHGERCDRREHQRQALPHDERHRADRQHQKRGEAAGRAAARVGQRRDREYVHAQTGHQLDVDLRPAPLDRRDRQQRVGEIRSGRADEQGGVGLPDASRDDRQEHDGQQHGDQQPEQVDEREHSPGEVARIGRSL